MYSEVSILNFYEISMPNKFEGEAPKELKSIKEKLAQSREDEVRALAIYNTVIIRKVFTFYYGSSSPPLDYDEALRT